MMSQRKNLKGYKRIGKRFVPPMKQIPNMRDYSYVNDMLPELLWLGLVHDKMGYFFGARALEAAVKAIDPPVEEAENDHRIESTGRGDPPSETDQPPEMAKPEPNLALQCRYSMLTKDQREALIAHWRAGGFLEPIREAISPLTLFEGFGLSFLGPPRIKFREEILLKQLSETVARHLDKYETPGIALHGAMLLTRLASGKLKFSSSIEIPDFNAVFDRPGSDEAKRAAGFIRASAGGEWGMLDLEPAFARHFWNECARFSPCSVPDWARLNG